jgi:hypothetical protein
MILKCGLSDEMEEYLERRCVGPMEELPQNLPGNVTASVSHDSQYPNLRLLRALLESKICR